MLTEYCLVLQRVAESTGRPDARGRVTYFYAARRGLQQAVRPHSLPHQPVSKTVPRRAAADRIYTVPVVSSATRHIATDTTAVNKAETVRL